MTTCDKCDGAGEITYEIEPGMRLVSEVCWKCGGKS